MLHDAHRDIFGGQNRPLFDVQLDERPRRQAPAGRRTAIADAREALTDGRPVDPTHRTGLRDAQPAGMHQAAHHVRREPGALLEFHGTLGKSLDADLRTLQIAENADVLTDLPCSLADAGHPPPMILSAFLLLMTVMTNIVSNNAAAAIGTPIAISIANQLGVSAEPFILAVLFGANMSFATPYGYQTNLLVDGPGGYRFIDYLKVGVPLTIVVFITVMVLLPILWPLQAL